MGADYVFAANKLDDVVIPKDVDVILMMNELTSNGSKGRIRLLAKRAHRSLVTLSRKSENWPEELSVVTKGKNEKVEDGDMANLKSVEDRHYETVLKIYADMTDKNSSKDEIVQELKKFWINRPLTNYHQLDGYIRSQRDYNKTPKWFNDWYKRRTDLLKSVKEKIEYQRDTGTTVSIPKETSVPVQMVQTPEIIPESEWRVLLEEENASLTKENASLKDKNTSLLGALRDQDKIVSGHKKEIEDLEFSKKVLSDKVVELERMVTNLKARPTVRSVDDLSKDVEAVRHLLRRGKIGKDEAFDIVVGSDE